MAKNLNVLFRYRKIDPVQYRKVDINKLRSNSIKKEDDWGLDEFAALKRYLRYSHYRTQKRRCCYCRRKLNPEGRNEHIDHVVARSIKVGWMFKPRNLVLSCYQCNTQKSKKPALQPGRTFRRLPKKSHNYVLFNPYTHIWTDHFEIDDDLFIKAKTNLGQDTIDELGLYDHKYSVIYADEADIFGEEAIQRATKRVNYYEPDTVEHKSAKKLIDEIERHLH